MVSEEESCGDAWDRCVVVTVVVPGNIPAVGQRLGEVVAAGDPAFGFFGMSHLAEGHNDYTRKVTILIEIGLN